MSQKKKSCAQLNLYIQQEKLKKSIKANVVKCYQPTLAKSSKTVPEVKTSLSTEGKRWLFDCL